MAISTTGNDNPRVDDNLERVSTQRPDKPSPFGRLIANYLKIVNAVGDDAEAAYKKVLEEMRENAAEVVVALAGAEKECDPSNYTMRWALVYGAVQMKHEATLPFFRNLVLTPIPAERSKTRHRRSTSGRETVLRTTAIDGLQSLAEGGNKEAVEVLFEALNINSISMRRAATQALLAANPKLKKRIAACLPKDMRFLIDLKRPHVSEVPQVKDPRKHLRKRPKRVRKKPPPKSIEESETVKSRKSRAPKTRASKSRRKEK